MAELHALVVGTMDAKNVSIVGHFYGVENVNGTGTAVVVVAQEAVALVQIRLDVRRNNLNQITYEIINV